MFLIETITLPPVTGQAGLIVRPTSGGLDFSFTCLVDATRTLTVSQNTTQTRLAMSPSPVPGTDRVHLRFWVDAKFGSLTAPYDYHCQAIDETGAVIVEAELRLNTQMPQGFTGLFATGDTTFAYFWMTSQ
jgi:hypothetical protein